MNQEEDNYVCDYGMNWGKEKGVKREEKEVGEKLRVVILVWEG